MGEWYSEANMKLPMVQNLLRVVAKSARKGLIWIAVGSGLQIVSVAFNLFGIFQL